MQIYTDGCCRNLKHGGWGYAVVKDNVVVYTKKGGVWNTTNNKMEMTAVIEALKYIKEHQSEAGGNFTICADSKYVINGATSWIRTWKKNGWMTSKKEPVLNEDLWREIDALHSQVSVKWQWVKGHSNNSFNDLADKLANDACTEITSLKTNTLLDSGLIQYRREE